MSGLAKGVVSHAEAEEQLCTPPVPVINMHHIIVEDLAEACRDVGFFQVINHGISQAAMDNAVEAASGFFRLPTETKQEFASDDLRQPVRYYHSSSQDGCMSRSFLKLYAHPLGDWTQHWPKQPALYREHMAKYAAEVRRVALQLMEAILQGLGLGKGYHLLQKLDAGLQVLAVNGYPEAPSSIQGTGTTEIAMAAHSDYAFLTVLLTNCPGLEVYDRRSSSWRAAWQQPLSGSLHVHVGDFMEVLSNGRVRALVHRALLNPEQARISIGSFHGFEMHHKVCCAQELVDERNPKRYRDSSFLDFLDYITANTDKDRSFVQSLRM